MTVAIRMKGDIDEMRVPATFQVFVAELNVAGATGKQYVIMSDMNGNSLAVNTQNILTAREIGVEEEAEDLIG